jgi:hypothetical protein
VIARFARLVFVLGVACSQRNADGTPCNRPDDCLSGACLRTSETVSLCAHRCDTSTNCARSEVCGRFDFRGREDGGIPVGPDNEVLRVCRASLLRATDAGTSPCQSSDQCGGRTCFATTCPRVCAAPCDDVADCPSGQTCNTAIVDRSGHGECIPIKEAGVIVDASDCPGDP